jgi:hypothetical protein
MLPLETWSRSWLDWQGFLVGCPICSNAAYTRGEVYLDLQQFYIERVATGAKRGEGRTSLSRRPPVGKSSSDGKW